MMNNDVLVTRFAAVCMELQEEYLKKPQDFNKQRILNDEFMELKREIVRRMEGERPHQELLKLSPMQDA